MDVIDHVKMKQNALLPTFGIESPAQKYVKPLTVFTGVHLPALLLCVLLWNRMSESQFYAPFQQNEC